MSVDECCKVMEEYRVRRLPVIDEKGSCCGIVAQADIAQHATKQETAQVVKGVSRPTEVASSRVATS
jgi:CBS-domain-containing membrane protein